MGEEFDTVLANGTWFLCPRPQHQHVIYNKWVYKIKQKQDGSIDRYKARLVSKGFDQEDGIDFTETFNPVIKPSTIWVIIAFAVQFNWSVRQLDVSNVFLHGVLLEEVYMEQPRFTWSNLMDLLTLDFLITFVVFTSLFMDSSRPLGHGIRDYLPFFLSLDFTHPWLIILYSCFTRMIYISSFLFMWMIF